MIRDKVAFEALKREIEGFKEVHASLDDDEADRRLAEIKRKFVAFRERENELAAAEIELAAAEIDREFERESKQVWDNASIKYADDPAGRAFFRISFGLTTLHMVWMRCKWAILWPAIKAINWMALKWKRVREMAE